MTEAAVEKVLSFWFAQTSRARWFKSDQGFDREIEKRFLSPIEAAARGALEPWVETPRGALALCILLDQFPRNVWRGTPRAFASDAEARRIADAALAAGHDRKLEPDERLFLYLPFEHSESLQDQERSVALFRALGDAEQLDYAVRHRDIIARFRRFPHRNRVLGRDSTPEELAFLQQPGSSF